MWEHICVPHKCYNIYLYKGGLVMGIVLLFWQLVLFRNEDLDYFKNPTENKR